MENEPSKKGRLVIDPTSYASPSSEASVTEAQMVGVPRPGDEILGGKYEIERIIGVGGMGVVASAFHKQLGQRVAIKFLSRQMQTAELVDRFIREGQACARIKSEHIASVLDVGVLENGTPYLMMEYLEGIDLDEYIGEHGAIPIEDAVEFVLQACDALAVAHSAGIVHRDLKPSNLFVTRRSDGSPLIKVLDFGISKIGDSHDLNPRSTLTRPGTMLGSPRYVSPEQLRNASNVDHRADIWAIGIVLHELVVGQPPFVSDTFADLCAMITAHPAVPLRQLHPEAPEQLEAAILKCIEKAPDSRFQNVAELARALAPIATEESKALALRVTKILQVAKATASLAPQSSRSGITPRRQFEIGRMDPTVARSGSSNKRLASLLPSDSNVSGLSITGTPFSRGWGARLGGIALLIALITSLTALFLSVRRARPTVTESVSGRTNTMPPAAVPLPPETVETPAPVASAIEIDPVPPASAATLRAPLVTTAKGVPTAKPPLKTPRAKTTAQPSSSGSPAPDAPTPQNESDMLNRRH